MINNIRTINALSKLHDQEKQFKRELSKTFLEYLDSLSPNKRLEQMESLLYDIKHISRLPTLDRRLTLQEKKCFYLVSIGKEIKEMARILGVSQRTIEYHRANITKKLKVSNLMAAVGSIQNNTANYFNNRLNFDLKLISYMPNNIYWLDRNCITQGCNNNILKLLNLKKLDDFVGINYSQMGELAGWTQGQAQSFEKDDREVMEAGVGKFNIEEPPLYNEKGEPVYYISSRVPVFDDKKKEVIGVVGISVDITERKKYEQQLKEEKKRSEIANQAKTEFLVNLCHDIHTPLNGIVGCAQTIQSQASNPKKVFEIANEIIKSSEALLEFLNRALESIKVASGEIPILKKKFDLQHALKLVIQLNQAKAAQKGLLLSLDYDKTIPAYIIGDPVRIQRIILELVTNAIKFTQRGEVKLTVKLMKQEARQLIVKFVVRDTGMGFSIDKQHEIYTRKHSVSSSEGIYSKTGPGLSVIKQFLDDLQAEIYIESQFKQGSSFTCLIPLQEPLLLDSLGVEKNDLSALEDLNATRAINLVTKTIENSLSDVGESRVLIVEDQEIPAKVLQNILVKLHCQVDIATDGASALQHIKQQNYDLIFMDIGLPGNDGCELTRRIRLKQWRRNPTVPIIGVTAHIDTENKRRCLEAGMKAVFIKPLNLEKALEILNAFVPNYQQTLSRHSISESEGIMGNELAVLDMNIAIQLMDNEEFVNEAFTLMVNDLAKDLDTLQQLFKNKEWHNIMNIAHKWKGGASYCGALRLEQACRKFITYLQMGSVENIKVFYDDMIREMIAAKEAANLYISSK